MKKIYLVIIFIMSLTFSYGQYLKQENFQSNSIPLQWSVTSESTDTWEITHNNLLNSNTAHVKKSTSKQLEKLTTPEVDLYYAESPILKFKYIASKDTKLSVLVSYNDGMHSRMVWSIDDEDNVDPTQINNAEINVEEFQGEYIKIIFQYEGGDDIYIDDVSVSEPDYEENDDIYCYFNSIPVAEPITFVGINEIQNRRTNENGQKSHLYFLDQKANVSKKESYPIYLEGDTKGDKINSFTIFIDWDHDGYFTGENETYFVGTLSNSNGIDGKQLIGNITVPANAKLGDTRIRIVKLASDNVSFYACGSGNYNGQVHDYTLVVNDFEFCEPTFINVSPITSVKIKNIENTSSSTSNSSVESFKDQVIELEQEGIETIEVKGNTNGNFTYSITAFFDWNKDGIFSENEIFEIGQITNSNGNDNISARKDIKIPQNAILGKTTMRLVMTKGNNYPSEICNLNTDGQIEDYSVEILTGNCIKATTSDGVENGHANVSKSIIANDFRIEANHKFDLSQIKFDLLIQADVSSANITFYEDNNGNPGNIIHSENNITPNDINFSDDSLSGFQLATYTFNLKNTLELSAGDQAKIYWVGINVNSDKSSALSATKNLNSNYTGRLSQDGGISWNELPGYGDWDGVLTLISSCGLLNTIDHSNGINEKSIKYYPNPVIDILTIIKEDIIGSVNIYNMVGQKIISTSINSKNGTINLSKLKSGIYIIKTDSDVFKIIKK